MSLDHNYQRYQHEFHLLQMEFKQVRNIIDKEVTPLRDHLGSATQRKTTDRSLAKLNHIHATLKTLVQLSRTVHRGTSI